jgi:hypothetical protein
MLDPIWIEAMAEDMGVVQRHRVHDAGLLTCALILSALERQSDAEGRWLDAASIYRELGGPDSGMTSISPPPSPPPEGRGWRRPGCERT